MSERHKHADLIHAWAEGAEIEVQQLYSTWKVVETPNWCETRCYRIKPKEPEGWENIPKHGVLCWVSDSISKPSAGHRIAIVYSVEFGQFQCSGNVCWKYATPLSNDEIKQFFRSGSE